jgi:SAM-dependent methyltransferase
MADYDPSMAESDLEQRQRREEAFWDEAFGGEDFGQRPQRRFYSVADAAFDRYDALIDAAAGCGADVLEYGCGPGSRAFRLAAAGSSVRGIDISSVAIETATARAASEGLSERTEFSVMDAEALEFADDSFDLICGTGILHHIDLGKAYGELQRTLRPGGRAIFLEPMGHNPAIEAYRRRTPDEHTVDEHPLKVADLEMASRHFERTGWRFFTLSSLVAVPFRNAPGFERMVSALDGLDRFLFRLSPRLAKNAWMVVMDLSGPRR